MSVVKINVLLNCNFYSWFFKYIDDQVVHLNHTVGNDKRIDKTAHIKVISIFKENSTNPIRKVSNKTTRISQYKR